MPWCCGSSVGAAPRPRRASNASHYESTIEQRRRTCLPSSSDVAPDHIPFVDHCRPLKKRWPPTHPCKNLTAPASAPMHMPARRRQGRRTKVEWTAIASAWSAGPRHPIVTVLERRQETTPRICCYRPHTITSIVLLLLGLCKRACIGLSKTWFYNYGEGLL